MNKQGTCFCPHCKKTVGWHVEPLNHYKQLLVTVITCGLWLPMWLTMVFAPTRVCDVCGSAIWRDESPSGTV